MTISFNSFAFIEQLSGEADDDLLAAIEAAVIRIYGHRPEWLKYELGCRRCLANATYREFKCPAGSVVLMFMMKSTTPKGLGRRLLCIGEENDTNKAFVYGPQGTEEFSADEVK